MRRIPVLSFTLAIVLGVVAGLYLDVRSGALLTTGAGLLVLSVIVLWRRGPGLLALSLVLLCFTSIAALRTIQALDRPGRQIVERLAAQAVDVEITGRVAEPAVATRFGSAVVLDRCQIVTESSRQRLGSLRIRLFGDSAALAQLGTHDLVLARGTLRSFAEAARCSRALALRMLVQQEAGSIAAGEVVSRRGAVADPHRAVDRLRQGIVGTFERRLSPDAAALAKALVLGDRQDFSDEFADQLRMTGLSHLFALSGMNVGLLMWLLWFGLGIACVPRTLRLWLLLGAVLVYVQLGREAPSLVRASLMAALFIVGHLLYRRAELLNAVAAAAFLELLWRPLHLVDAGFQLSYLAVAGLAIAYPAVRDLCLSAWSRLRARRLQVVVDLVAAAVAAQVATLPLIALLFQRIPLLGVLGNVVAVPAFGLFLILLVLHLLLSAIWSPLAVPLEHALNLFALVLGRGVESIAALPLASMVVGSVSPFLMVLVYAAVLVVVAGLAGGRRGWTLAGLLLAANLAVWPALLRPVPPAVRVSFLAVENGDAILVSTREGRHVLIDAGPVYGEWTAAQRILPALAERGVRRLDALILTHPDADHVGGAAELMCRLPVVRLFTNGEDFHTRSAMEAILAGEGQDLRPCALAAGQAIDLSAHSRLKVLWPSDGAKGAGENAQSLVLRLESDSAIALLTADIDTSTEQHLLAWSGMLDADLLKVSHHGSRSASSVEFLNACSPKVAVISCGRRNPYGHPHPGVVARLRAGGSEVRSTAREGTLTFVPDGKKWQLVEEAGCRLLRSWKLPDAPFAATT